jgi:hypothetical protein
MYNINCLKDVHGDADKFLCYTLDFDAEQLLAIEKHGAHALLEIYSINDIDMAPVTDLSGLYDNDTESKSSESSPSSSSESGMITVSSSL